MVCVLLSERGYSCHIICLIANLCWLSEVLTFSLLLYLWSFCVLFVRVFYVAHVSLKRCSLYHRSLILSCVYTPYLGHWMFTFWIWLMMVHDSITFDWHILSKTARILQSFWTLHEREKSLALAGNRTTIPLLYSPYLSRFIEFAKNLETFWRVRKIAKSVY